MLFERLRWPLALLCLVSVGGTAGYQWLEGWDWLDALWMVVITLSTIGYGEVQPLSVEGRIFTIGLVTVGLGLGTYAIGQASQYFIEASFLEDIGARRKRRIMERMQGHTIVIGGGRLGREVTAELMHRGHQVLLIENEPSALGTSPVPPTVELLGDGTDEDLLERAGLAKARSIAIATGSDATNVFITLTVRQMYPEVHIVTRVDDQRTVNKALRAGADAVINPYGISGARMAQGLLHPHAARVLDLAVGRDHDAFEIQDVAIGKVEGYNGRLEDLHIPERHGIQLIAHRPHGGALQTSLHKATVLAPGDVAVVVGQPDKVRAFARAASGA